LLHVTVDGFEMVWVVAAFVVGYLVALVRRVLGRVA
jgi:hypothetical protein